MTFTIKIAHDEACEFCGSKDYSNSYYTGKNKLVCEDCAENLQICDCCGEYREETEFLYNAEICDACCDKKADLMQDRD
jgi:hypothetical protein